MESKNGTNECKKCQYCKIKKCYDLINTAVRNKEQFDKSIEEISSKTIRSKKEILELYDLVNTIKTNLTLKNRFSINLSFASFLLSAVALALSLVACL